MMHGSLTNTNLQYEATGVSNGFVVADLAEAINAVNAIVRFLVHKRGLNPELKIDTSLVVGRTVCPAIFSRVLQEVKADSIHS